MRNTRSGRNGRLSSRWIGLAGSLATHIVLLAGLFAFSPWTTTPSVGQLVPEPSAAAIAVSVFEATSPEQDDELGDPPLRDQTLAVPRPLDAPAGEKDNPARLTVAPSDADGLRPLVPAPDQGTAGGHPPDHAYRRDRTTLRARLTDGADEAQPAQLRTSRRAASPQAIRREATVGIGDAVRSIQPGRAPIPKPPAARPVLAQVGGAAGDDAAETATAAREPVPTPRVAEHPSRDRAMGPLDAEKGPRSFDVEKQGPAVDDQTLRAASNERRPGLTDFSRPSVTGVVPAADGRGPGSAPGAVPRATTGAAPAALGARDPKELAPEVAERTQERRYQRYILEIRERVHGVLEFPKALALRLEQGVTIVEFVIDVDGRLGDGPRIVKSSGFEEFDRAAVRAVRRAAPFPPMGAMGDRQTARRLPVSMPVTFDNPVIR